MKTVRQVEGAVKSRESAKDKVDRHNVAAGLNSRSISACSTVHDAG